VLVVDDRNVVLVWNDEKPTAIWFLLQPSIYVTDAAAVDLTDAFWKNHGFLDFFKFMRTHAPGDVLFCDACAVS